MILVSDTRMRMETDLAPEEKRRDGKCRRPGVTQRIGLGVQLQVIHVDNGSLYLWKSRTHPSVVRVIRPPEPYRVSFLASPGLQATTVQPDHFTLFCLFV